MAWPSSDTGTVVHLGVQQHWAARKRDDRYSSDVPVMVSGLSGVKAIAGGDAFSLAVLTGGDRGGLGLERQR